MSTPVTLNCYEVLAKAREIAPRQPLESRADMLAAAMAKGLSDAGIDLQRPHLCRLWLLGLYAPSDVNALLTRAIDEAAALQSEAAKLKLARAL